MRQIRARFSDGVLKPLEELDIQEGQEVMIAVEEIPSVPGDAFERTAGGWKDLVDTDQLLKDFKESRKILGREINL